MSAPSLPQLIRTTLSLGMLTSAAVLAACDDDRPSAAPTSPAMIADARLSTASGPADVPGARGAVQSVISALDAAWNAGDATAYAAPFAEDARVITPTGGVVVSRTGVRQLHAFLFANPFAGSTRTTLTLEITFLTGTIAVAERLGDVTNYAFLPPGVVPTMPGVIRARERHVLEKREGTWQIILTQITPLATGM